MLIIDRAVICPLTVDPNLNLHLSANVPTHNTRIPLYGIAATYARPFSQTATREEAFVFAWNTGR